MSITGALVELLAWWVDAKRAVPPDEIDRHFRRLASGVIGQMRDAAG